MENNAFVTVGLIGIPDIETRRLQSVFNHSRDRQTSYKISELKDLPMVLMVNADEPTSLVQWRVYRDGLEKRDAKKPLSVLVSRDREFNTQHYQVRRPLIGARVISMLDRLAVQELNVRKEVAILEEESEKKVTDEENWTNIASGNAENYRALVVDDSLPVRIQMDLVLRQYTSHVDFAETGEEAFELINNNEYDIIFLDVVLPGVDGYEVCRVIKEDKAKDTPVIMLTGNSSRQDRIKGKLVGCDTYLIKPVSKLVFNEVVNQYLCHPKERPMLAG